MKKTVWTGAVAVIAWLAFGSIFPAYAQCGQSGQAPAAKGFLAEFSKRYEDSTTKLIRLAEAIPQEKFTWRPMEGTRSVSVVFVHVAASNYAVAALWGTPVPKTEDLPNYHNITNKAQVIEKLKQSVEHMKRALRTFSDSDMDRPPRADLPYPTYRAVLANFLVHISEHLGQSIAYARVNQVVPPWTEEASR